MQARRAARELALILFSQLDKEITSYTSKDFEEIILKSVRILSNNSTEELKLSVGTLIDIKNYIDTYESEHETNLSRPIGAKDKPVEIPTTRELSESLETVLDVVEKALLGLEIAEFTTLEAQSDVQAYVIRIAEAFKKHHKEVDEQIQTHTTGWDISRLVKIDKDILRIAIIELMYTKEVPLKVAIDEAVELAKKYSTEDSSSFVNGVLAKVVVDNGLK